MLVIDRGMVTEANLEGIAARGFAFISALRAPQLKRLVREGDLQLSLLDETNLAEIASDDFPGERLIVCRNPLVGAERARKREALLQATEAALAAIRGRVERGTLAARRRSGSRSAMSGTGTGCASTSGSRSSCRRCASSARRPRSRPRPRSTASTSCGTSVPAAELDRDAVVRSYKQLAHVERDEHPPLGDDPVASSRRSPEVERKAQRKRGERGLPCHSWPTLLVHLALRCRNTIRLAGTKASFEKLTEATPVQARALELRQDSRHRAAVTTAPFPGLERPATMRGGAISRRGTSD